MNLRNASGLVVLIFGLGLVQAKAQPPTITRQPASLKVGAGGTAIFTVEVSSAGPFSYQWQCNGTNLPNGIITTVAGGGMPGNSGDDGLATSASLSNPTGVAVDASENLFIGAAGCGPVPKVEASIRKVDSNGIITTIKGATGLGGRFIGLATDASGNLYIAGQGQTDSKVRKVDSKGNISTVAGHSDDFAWAGYSGDGGLATSAQLSGPAGLAWTSSGNLFISDFGNDRVRKVNINGIITTVAGNGKEGYWGDGRAATEAQLHWPSGVAVDASGNLFIVDEGNDRVRKVNTDGIISTVAGGGTGSFLERSPATNVSLYILSGGLAVDASGNLFIATFHEIRMVDTNGIITTAAGNGVQGCSGDGGPATKASLGLPQGLALDRGGNLFIADMYCSCIRKVGNTQRPTLVLNDVTARDAGNYQIAVSGPGGSVTSCVAALTLK